MVPRLDRQSMLIRSFAAFLLFAGTSLAVGFIVPSVFELSQKPTSRSRYPDLEFTALAVMVATVVMCASCWITVALLAGREPRLQMPAPPRRKFQFSLAGIFVAMTGAAMLLAVVRWLDVAVMVGLIMFSALAIVVWSFWHDWPVRFRAWALVASLFLPFVWMIAFNKPFGHTSGLALSLPLGPGILPAELTRVFLLGGPRDQVEWLAALYVIVQMVAGVWLVRRGGRLAIAYLVLVALHAYVNSLLVLAAYRA